MPWTARRRLGPLALQAASPSAPPCSPPAGPLPRPRTLALASGRAQTATGPRSSVVRFHPVSCSHCSVADQPRRSSRACQLSEAVCQALPKRMGRFDVKRSVRAGKFVTRCCATPGVARCATTFAAHATSWAYVRGRHRHSATQRSTSCSDDAAPSDADLSAFDCKLTNFSKHGDDMYLDPET